MVERGQIVNRIKSTQVIDYAGLRYGQITPTDVDGLIEYKDKAFVFIEYKSGKAELPYGQKLALERLIDSLNKPAILIHASHEHPETQDIDGANAIVENIYYKGKWYQRGFVTVKSVIDSFLENITNKASILK